LDDIGVVVGEIEFDIGLGLTPGRRGPGVKQEARLFPRDLGGAAAPAIADGVIERDGGQVAGAALPIRKCRIGVAALAIELAVRRRASDIPEHAGIGETADAD